MVNVVQNSQCFWHVPVGCTLHGIHVQSMSMYLCTEYFLCLRLVEKCITYGKYQGDTRSSMSMGNNDGK